MTVQQIITLILLAMIIAFSFWAYKESIAYHRQKEEKEAQEQNPRKRSKH